MIKIKPILTALFLYIACIANAQNVQIPRLSPQPADAIENRISLNGVWKFNPEAQPAFWKQSNVTSWKDIQVPGQWLQQGFEVKKAVTATYFRTFEVPATWKDRRIKIRCNAIYSFSEVYVNGHKAGKHLGGFTPFELDITEFAKAGQSNTLAIGVKSESLVDSLSSAAKYALHNLGGITRDVFLFSLPETNISMFHVATTFDKEYINATLQAEITIHNESGNSKYGKDLTLEFSLEDASGQIISLDAPQKTVTTIQSHSFGKQTFDFAIKEPKKWDPEHPNLYVFKCKLKRGGEVLETVSRKVGFRQIEVRGNQVFVNNMPIKLRGVCRHEVYPTGGRSLPPDTWRKDVEIFKHGNVNYIRTSHYPPDEALLEACDELGMFVEEEAPFCWAHNTPLPKDSITFYAAMVQQHLEIANRDKSHPSILIWSLGNESTQYETYFKAAAKQVKAFDPTRPRVFSQWSPDADKEELEIGNHHYPGPKGPEMYKNAKRPMVFDEYVHLNAYNRLELTTDPGLRSMWGPLLYTMWENMYKTKAILGGALWAGIDDTFFLPDGKIVGYGTWGPIDGWRREKPEYWEMKKCFSPIRIRQSGNINQEGIVSFEIENRHDFTDLSECRIVWSSGKEKGEQKISLAPKSTGNLQIQLPSAIESNTLRIQVFSRQGFMMDDYLFELRPQITTAKINKQAQKITWKEQANSYVIHTDKTDFYLDKLTGNISVSSKKGKTIACNSPELMVLPLNGEGYGIQMDGTNRVYEPYTDPCKNWISTAVNINPQPDKIEIVVYGKYSEATGKYIHSIYPDGQWTIDYDFVMETNVSPRQTGLVFTLNDTTYQNLTWKRKGFWSVYPSYHIARLEGTARLYTDGIPFCNLAGPASQPDHDWRMDQNYLGSNDFRSTKENIRVAKLTTVDNTGLQVTSDGSQHFRAWRNNNKICFVVADYNNPGSENYLSPHAAVFYRPLKTGDHVKGTVFITPLTP